MAAELTTQVVTLGADSGYDPQPRSGPAGGDRPTPRNSGFPGQFAQANRIAHRWMFTDAVAQRRLHRIAG